MEKIRKLRSLRQILFEIKNDDPNSCVTEYMIKKLASDNKVYSILVGNKYLYDMEQVIKALGLL